MVGHEGSSRSYAHVGVPEPHHPVTHHGDKPENIEKYAKITTYHALKLAEFIGKLKATPDGDGTLLDHSLTYFGSGMGNGNAHDRNNVPVLLVGGANGRLKVIVTSLWKTRADIQRASPWRNFAGVDVPRLASAPENFAVGRFSLP
jgi:hypothetical protein